MKKFIYVTLIFFLWIIFNSSINSVAAFNQYSKVQDNGEDEYCKYKIYSNPSYKVILRYPKKWTPNLNFGSINNIPLSYSGDDGYFVINAAAGDLGLDEVIKNEAFHKLQPYGSSPKIEKVQYKGSEGAFIFPSEDQPPSMKGQSAFIIKYPRSITISNKEYNYLILYADKNDIKNIVDTLIILK